MAAETTSHTQQERSGGRGAKSAGDGGGGRKRAGWLWWLLGLLAVVAATILLISLLGGDDDPSPSGQATRTQTEAGTQPQAQAGADQGSLTAGDQPLLPVPAAGLAAYAGEAAQGQEVRVHSVVEDEGFWVGSSMDERVYVEYGGDVGENENQGFEPTPGDRVNLTGPVRPAPEDPAQTLNLPAQDAQMVSEQGAYINADRVETR
jgi:hypothetical protein